MISWAVLPSAPARVMARMAPMEMVETERFFLVTLGSGSRSIRAWRVLMTLATALELFFEVMFPILLRSG